MFGWLAGYANYIIGPTESCKKDDIVLVKAELNDLYNKDDVAVVKTRIKTRGTRS